jgi:hypothetical protein
MLKEGHVLIYVRSEEDENGDQELLVVFTDPNPVAGGQLQRKTLVGNLPKLASEWAAGGNLLCVTNDIQPIEKSKPKAKKKGKTKK